MTLRNRAHFEQLDCEDPLAHFRDEFVLPKGMLYLDGNSLGAMPKKTIENLNHCLTEQWGKNLIGSWVEHDWLKLPQRVGAKIAPLIGAQAHEVVVADSTSVNLFKLIAAATRLRPDRAVILAESDSFPTVQYMAQGLANYSPVELRVVARDQIIDSLDADVAVLLLTHVHYKTGAVYDMATITARAHAAGALTIWDLSHSAGAVPVELNAAGADFAAGCGYKFLNGGPGAPAYLYVAEALQDRIEPILSGWLGHEAPFDFREDYVPSPGILRNLSGTHPVLALTALDTSIDLLRRANFDQVVEKGRGLGDLFIDQLEARCVDQGFELLSPRAAAERGGQVSFDHPQGGALMETLIARGCVGDFRPPYALRFGFSPLYTRYTDIFDAVEKIATATAELNS